MSFFNRVLKLGGHPGLHEAILNLAGPKVRKRPLIEGRAARAARIASERRYGGDRASPDKPSSEPVSTLEEGAPVAAAPVVDATNGVVTDDNHRKEPHTARSSICATFLATLPDRPRLKRSMSGPSTTQRAKMAHRDGVPSPNTHTQRVELHMQKVKLLQDEQSATDTAESSVVVMEDTTALTAPVPNQSAPRLRTKQFCPMPHGPKNIFWFGDSKRTKSRKDSKCHSRKWPQCEFEPFGVSYSETDLQVAKQNIRDENEKQGLDAASREAKRAVRQTSKKFFEREATKAHEEWRAGRGPASFSRTELGADECVREVSVVVPGGCNPGDYFAHLDPKRRAIVYVDPTSEQPRDCYKSSRAELDSYKPGAHSTKRTRACPIGPVPNPKPVHMSITMLKRNLRPIEEMHRSLSAAFDDHSICGDSDGGSVAGSSAGSDDGSDGGSVSDGGSDIDEGAEKVGGRSNGGLGEGGGGGGGSGSGGDDEAVGGHGGGGADEDGLGHGTLSDLEDHMSKDPCRHCSGPRTTDGATTCPVCAKPYKISDMLREGTHDKAGQDEKLAKGNLDIDGIATNENNASIEAQDLLSNKDDDDYSPSGGKRKRNARQESNNGQGAQNVATHSEPPGAVTTLTAQLSDVQGDIESANESAGKRIETVVDLAKVKADKDGAARTARKHLVNQTRWGAVQKEIQVEPNEFLEKFGLSCKVQKQIKERIWDTHRTVATRFNETPLLTAYTPIASGWTVCGGSAAKDFKLIVGCAVVEEISERNGLESIDIMVVKTNHSYCVLVTETGAARIVNKARSMTFEAAERARATKPSSGDAIEAKACLDKLAELGVTNHFSLALPDTRKLTERQTEEVIDLTWAIRKAVQDGGGDSLSAAISDAREAMARLQSATSPQQERCIRIEHVT